LVVGRGLKLDVISEGSDGVDAEILSGE
jgi:hypothetical protein